MAFPLKRMKSKHKIEGLFARSAGHQSYDPVPVFLRASASCAFFSLDDRERGREAPGMSLRRLMRSSARSAALRNRRTKASRIRYVKIPAASHMLNQSSGIR